MPRNTRPDMRQKILKDIAKGCAPIAAGFILAALLCLLLSLCSCKPQQKIVEVERLTHDTVSVMDTVHVKDIVVVHDSVYITNTIQETIHDTVTNNVAWKYYTFDSIGNISSLLDYTSNTQHGTMLHTATQSASTNVSNMQAFHEEKGSHSESTGHSEALQSKEQVKTGLTGWQKFVIVMGYILIVVLALALMFGGMHLYGKFKKL